LLDKFRPLSYIISTFVEFWQRFKNMNIITFWFLQLINYFSANK